MNLKTATKFIQEVREEGRKITWPSFKDTRMMSLMVLILVVIVGAFLVLVDLTIGGLLSWVLGLNF